MDELTRLLDTSLSITLNKRLIQHIEDDFELLSDYYVENLYNLANPSFKIDFIELMCPDIMSEIDAKNMYKYLVTNNRGFDMLCNIIKTKHSMIPHTFIVNNLIHHYIQDILNY